MMSRAFTVVGMLGPGGLFALSLSCVQQAEEKPTPEDLEFVKKNLLPSAPTPQFPVNADLDGKVTYLGLDVSPNPIQAGKDVKLTHYWKVRSAPGEGWRSFTHLNGPNNQGFINADHGPVRGKYPVSQWKDNDIIRDDHIVRLPATWQYDRVAVFVGLWKRNERMAVKAGSRDSEGRVVAASVPVQGATPPPPSKRYLARKVAKPPKLDGKLDEAAWKDAPSTGAFVNTMTGAAAEHQTEAKLLWDDKNLYIAFQNFDSDVWSELVKRDDKLWTQEAVEVLIDADGNRKSYVEIQVAPNGTIFDSYLPEYRKYEDAVDPKRKPFGWNSGLKAVVKVDGTLNQRSDEDKSWTVELAFPLADSKGLGAEGPRIPPAYGDVWKLGLFRMDAPKDKPQQASAWSPPLVGDFHALDKFGELVFVDDKGNVPAPAVANGDTKEAIRQVLSGLPAASPPGAVAAAEIKLDEKKAAASAKAKPRTTGDTKKQ